MSTATILAKHAAPGQYLGYALQPVRLCYHLLTCERTSHISLEHVEDVAAHLEGGATIYEQMKSALTGNPVSDWSTDFWKTISYWISAGGAGEIDITQSQFRYYVTPVKTGAFAEMLSNADTPAAVTAATTTIAQALKKKGSKLPACIEDLKVFLDAPTALRTSFVTRFKVVSCDEDPVTPLRELLRYGVQPELLDDLCKSIVGIAKEEADQLIRQRKPAIISAANFRIKVHAFIRTMSLPNLLISLAPQPPEGAVADLIATRNVSTTLIQPGSEFRLDGLRFFHRKSEHRRQERKPPVDLWTTQERALTTTPQASHQNRI